MAPREKHFEPAQDFIYFQDSNLVFKANFTAKRPLHLGVVFGKEISLRRESALIPAVIQVCDLIVALTAGSSKKMLLIFLDILYVSNF